MKAKLLITGALALTLLSGCATNTGTGALVGGGAGAIIGGAAGGWPGAAIGAGVGAAVGGIVGNSLDARDRERLERDHPQTLRRIDNDQKLTMQDVINLTDAGVRPDNIIDMMKNSNSTYYLTSRDVVKLKKAGVDQRVINYMINS